MMSVSPVTTGFISGMAFQAHYATPTPGDMTTATPVSTVCRRGQNPSCNKDSDDTDDTDDTMPESSGATRTAGAGRCLTKDEPWPAP